MKLAISLLLVVLITLFSCNAFAEPFISLDKKSYVQGDTIKVSGNVEYQEDMVIVIQLRSSSDIVAIDQSFPSRSGKFSATFETDGPKWQEIGTYIALVSYAGQKIEKTFQFSKPKLTPLEETQVNQDPIPIEKLKPKITIRGFPDPAQSPQYYYDRYDNEPEFKRWFDSLFTVYTIQEIVGYKPTYVSEFPDPMYSPQHYIDRYNNEDLFKEWFDTQFPDKTIYDIVGVTEQTRIIAPGWIKQYARMWSGQEIDDERFIDGITDLIRLNIIEINSDIIMHDSPDKIIPSWLKITAGWYGQDMITDDDFLSGIQYLIEKEIIVV